VTPSERFTLLTTLISGVFVAALGVLATAIRDHYTLNGVRKSLEELVRRKDEEHKDLRERLTGIEKDILTFYRDKASRSR
jgi:hypothetical protein